jgi:GNAT superfamily N-acetyltransferase
MKQDPATRAGGPPIPGAALPDGLEIRRVRTRADFRRFIHFPETLHRDEPCWAPPLWSEEKRTYDPRRNPVLRESDFVLFLAWRDGRVVGRNLAYVNHLYNAHYYCRTGMFGAFDSIDDPSVAAGLMKAAEDWLRGEGANEIIGPIHPVDEVWGTLVEGFDRPAIFLTPWNPPCHDRLLCAQGYAKFKDLLAWELDDREEQYRLDPRYEAFHDRFLARHPDYAIRPIDVRNLARDAAHIWRISNVSLIHNWGFLPASHDVLADNFRRLKPLVDPDAIWFVEFRGRPVAFCLGYADLNQIIRPIRGRLLPLGWLRLLAGIRRIREFRLFGLAVDPRHAGKGLDALLYVHLTRAMKPRRIRLEANWILEENLAMNTALRRLGMSLVSRYRIYSKDLAGQEG